MNIRTLAVTLCISLTTLTPFIVPATLILVLGGCGGAENVDAQPELKRLIGTWRSDGSTTITAGPRKGEIGVFSTYYRFTKPLSGNTGERIAFGSQENEPPVYFSTSEYVVTETHADGRTVLFNLMSPGGSVAQEWEILQNSSDEDVSAVSITDNTEVKKQLAELLGEEAAQVEPDELKETWTRVRAPSALAELEQILEKQKAK